VWSRGDQPVDVGGLLLRSATGESELPSATVPPGGFALIVPADFVADDGVDAPAAASAVLVRLDENHLGGRGLRASGEVVELLEPDGRPVSRFSTVGLAPARGQSASRVGDCDVDSSYAATGGSGQTPGWQ
jgi:hypothetical protein